jgi:hypothetical protein
MWKEAGSWPDIRYSLSIFLEGLRKTTKISVRYAGFWAEI